MEKFRGTISLALPRIGSDHTPILLETSVRSGRQAPFRFEAAWLEDKELVKEMEKWWLSFPRAGSASFSVWQKFKWLKERLKEWSRDFFGKLDRRAQALSEEVQALNVKEESVGLDEADRVSRASKQLEMERIWHFEELKWKVGAKMRWQLQGDRNTKKFHSFASFRRKINDMSKMIIEGHIVEVAARIESHVIGFFSQLYAQETCWRPRLFNLGMEILPSNLADSLERDLDVEEISAALNSYGSSKAPGPDGYPLCVLKEGWSFGRDDIMEAMREFQNSSFLDWRINNTFITLIPKREGAMDIRERRPISLVGSVYKIITKALAKRIKRCMRSIIGKAQGAFVEGRQILDGVLVANELIDSWKKGGRPGLVCKIDFEKAYDYVNWDFLQECMEDMGFGLRWRSWIHTYISTVHFSVLINGESNGFFRSSKGIRQGDPLSPLFIHHSGGGPE